MKFISLKYQDVTPNGWDFTEIHFKHLNLFVGGSGSGKTRILNIIFNICKYISKGVVASSGQWTLVASHGTTRFRWYCKAIQTDQDAIEIVEEEIDLLEDGGQTVRLVSRTRDTFTYRDGKLPKMAKNVPAVHLLKENDDIAPLHAAFSRVGRRNFFSDELERACAYGPLPGGIIEHLREKGQGLESIYQLELTLHARLYILAELFPDIYNDICRRYMSTFPTIQKMEFTDLTNLQKHIRTSEKMPVLVIREKDVPKPVSIAELSSGMQKVLLLLTDIRTLPGDIVYMIDEYENSLGINAIDFLPPFLNECGEDNQFILTTHHPYLINNIPISNWLVFQRRGMRVTIQDGKDLAERFGKSKQRAFIQLINDPFYLGAEQ